MRSWVPRPPSEALKRRLFPSVETRSTAARTVRGAPPAPRLNWLAWLAPATAALAVLAALAWQQPRPARAQHGSSAGMLALALSNANATASSLAALSNDQYALPAANLASTNLRPLSSSFSPRSLSTTAN